MDRTCNHPYLLTGKVIAGKGLGRTVNMPTANLDISSEAIVPKEGVYATRVTLRGNTYAGLTNVGRRPSVDDDNRTTVETYILDFDEDIYGETLTIEFVSYIRQVMKLANLEEVRQQVNRDIEVARSLLQI